MWHFISWIETDNEPNILFLTDAEVYDDPEDATCCAPTGTTTSWAMTPSVPTAAFPRERHGA